ncbi:MAG: alpha-glucan phosphorylase, partial [Thermodesulfobacteriota bacterium]
MREKDQNGDPLDLSLPIGDHEVRAGVWRAQVGRVPLYLLDTDTPGNSSSDRQITAELYGGDKETRMRQEILLGMGGVRALERLGISPAFFHMNEGHTAFAMLERIRQLVQKEGLSFEIAREIVKSSTL